MNVSFGRFCRKRAIVWSLTRCQTTADTVINFDKTINLAFFHPFGPLCYFYPCSYTFKLTLRLETLFLQICDFSHTRGHLRVSLDGLRKKRDCS